MTEKEKTKHKWVDRGTNYGVEYWCENCCQPAVQFDRQRHVSWNLDWEGYCEDYEHEKKRQERVLRTASHFVVSWNLDGVLWYYTRDGRFDDFTKARFYSRKGAATQAMQTVIRYKKHLAEDLRVIKIDVKEPR